ncbi:ATP-binding protein [uncultured Cocleimonas sp.]|uniref:ATP-binding protein n=1 Tax=uncultured Cocleimonas sp. TaxID=1051587 RepID=UPI00260E8B67|nr:ATP-binding protein [uncultured Cocleimonas sp.]
MIKQNSLQHELNHWIILTAVTFIFLGGIISGGLAFYHLRELQDQTLIQIATLISQGKLNDSSTLHHDVNKDTIILNELGKKQHIPIIPLDITDGLHSLELDNENWRVLVVTQPISHRRFSISQQTQLRDNIAINTILSVFLPIALLASLMLFIINRILRRQFRSLGKLTKLMDRQDGVNLEKLSENNIPIEISPFVHSINTLLERIEGTINKQQRFIADAAHELRTPLTALSLQVETLSQANETNLGQESLKQLQKSLERLRRLVTQLLDLARLQNEGEYVVQKVSFNQIVEDAMADLYLMAEASDIDLGMVRYDENISVNDQQGRLSQLVYNAIDNAIHYSSPGGKVDISLYLEKNKAVFLVEDNGIGIPEVELEQVMQAFYRVNESNKPGNGLGLSISHEISKLLGGEIHLENRTSGGLRFRYMQLAKPQSDIAVIS